MSNTKAIESKVEDLIAGALAAIQYDLVRVQLTPGGRYMTLQVMTERADRKPMTVEDCVKISHALSPRLDGSEVLTGPYTLEISSPGVERPLMRLKDFERFAGHMAHIELADPLDGTAGGQRCFQGNIVRVTGNAHNAEIEINTKTGAVRVPANAITTARLLLTETKPDPKDGTKH